MLNNKQERKSLVRRERFEFAFLSFFRQYLFIDFFLDFGGIQFFLVNDKWMSFNGGFITNFIMCSRFIH